MQQAFYAVHKTFTFLFLESKQIQQNQKVVNILYRVGALKEKRFER